MIGADLMGTILDLQLKGTSSPPPPARQSRDERERRRRARKALSLMERGLYVSDEQSYTSRNTAKACARRLADAVVEFEDVPPEHLHRITRLRTDGWHWWVGFKDER